MHSERSLGLRLEARNETLTDRSGIACLPVYSRKWSKMTQLLVLIALMSCQPSPVGPSQNVATDGPIVPPGSSQWDGLVEVTLEDFDSTEELRSDRKAFPVENMHLEHVFHDKNVAFSAGGLTRSMRYDWVDQGTKSLSIGRGIRLPEFVSEVWVELAVRWSRNYSPCNPADPPCAHKILFLQVTPDGNERWDVNVGGAGEVGPEVHLTMSSPYGKIEGQSGDRIWGIVGAQRRLESALESRPFELAKANAYFDERWHLLRLHAKHSTNKETYDARMRLWVDGELIYDSEQIRRDYGGAGFSTNDGTKIRAILLGRNKDKGLDHGTESLWIGRVRAWKEDPGW